MRKLTSHVQGVQVVALAYKHIGSVSQSLPSFLNVRRSAAGEVPD